MELPPGLEDDVLLAVADSHGTPTYVMDAAWVRQRFGQVRDAFSDAVVHYAAKANNNPRVLELLHGEGANLDVVSLGEVAMAERAGYSPDELMYTGVNPPMGEVEGVVDRGIDVNADSVEVINRVADAGGSVVGIRVNPGVGAGHHRDVQTGADPKFGLRGDLLMEGVELARKRDLEVVGLHMHIGSGVDTPEPYRDAVRSMMEIAKETGLREDLRYIDIGGGFSVPYRPGDEEMNLEEVAEVVESEMSVDAELRLEPGRYVVADSTVLLTRVNTRKHSVVGVDAGFNTLMRPAMYGSYHHITNLSRDSSTEAVDIAGPICESGDYLARDREIASPRVGDVLAVHTTGAYGFAMASRYNGRLLPAEVLVDGGDAELIRTRDSPDDLMENVMFD